MLGWCCQAASTCRPQVALQSLSWTESPGQGFDVDLACILFFNASSQGLRIEGWRGDVFPSAILGHPERILL